MTSSRPLKFCLFGASPDTGNLGVSALCYSVISGLLRQAPDAQLTVFDEGHGLRTDQYRLNGSLHPFALCGATQTRRLWQRRSLWNIRLSHWLGGLGSPAVACIRDCDAVLDISGGDSFTDLYGPRRFAAVSFSKRLALESGKPLILLPQTYGPYRDPKCRRIAGDIVRRAAMCWARDERSFAVLKEMLGNAFDPARHRSGVDVAFALDPRAPSVPVLDSIATWLAACGTGVPPVNEPPLPPREWPGEGNSLPPFPPSHLPTSAQPPDGSSAEGSSGRAPHRPSVPAGGIDAERSRSTPAPSLDTQSLILHPQSPPLIGFNVSGLIWHDPVAMRRRFGFIADYREVVLGFLRRILRDTDANMILVPHVLTPPGHYESDPGANQAVCAALQSDSDTRVAAAALQRVATVPPIYTCEEMKWIIARTDWFCGTRMHAAIAGLSSGVPTAAIAYSVKTAGVFETCGQVKHVADPRKAQTPEVVDQLWNSFNEKDNSQLSLSSTAQVNVHKAEQQMAAIVAHTQPGVALRRAQEVPA